MAKKMFRVYPNPFLSLDHDGYPASACPCDMLEHVGMTVRKWVGAKLDPANTMLLEKLSVEEARYRDPRQQTRFAFDFSQPTEILVTEYYRDRIRSNEIFCADLETYKLAGIGKVEDFIKPEEALKKAKAAALKQWAAERGSDEKPEGVDSLDDAIGALGRSQAASSPQTGPSGDPKPQKPSKGA